MPGGDGTGPRKTGSGAGHGMDRGQGRGMSGRRGGPTGNCVCTACGTTVPHKRSVPCFAMKCPKCGTMMTRR